MKPKSISNQAPTTMLYWRSFNLVVTLATVAVGCSDVTDRTVPPGARVVASCPADAASGFYFSPDTSVGVGEGFQRWLSAHFRQAAAPPLWCGENRPATYRLLYLPSARPALLISIEQGPPDFLRRTRWAVRTVQFEDPRSERVMDSPDRVRVAAHNESVLADSDMQPLLNAMKNSFWNSPLWRSATEVEDGSVIVIEAQKNGTYRLVARSNIDSAIFELATSFLRIAKVAAPDLEDQTYILKKRETAAQEPGRK